MEDEFVNEMILLLARPNICWRIMLLRIHVKAENSKKKAPRQKPAI